MEKLQRRIYVAIRPERLTPKGLEKLMNLHQKEKLDLLADNRYLWANASFKKVEDLQFLYAISSQTDLEEEEEFLSETNHEFRNLLESWKKDGTIS